MVLIISYQAQDPNSSIIKKSSLITTPSTLTIVCTVLVFSIVLYLIEINVHCATKVFFNINMMDKIGSWHFQNISYNFRIYWQENAVLSNMFSHSSEWAFFQTSDSIIISVNYSQAITIFTSYFFNFQKYFFRRDSNKKPLVKF